MADDETFRLILALGMAVFLPVALYHRIRSQASGEKLDRRQEGLFILFTLRPCGLAAMGGLAAFCPQPRFHRLDRLRRPRAPGHPDHDRGSEARRAVRRRLPALHGADEPLLPAPSVDATDG